MKYAKQNTIINNSFNDNFFNHIFAFIYYNAKGCNSRKGWR